MFVQELEKLSNDVGNRHDNPNHKYAYYVNTLRDQWLVWVDQNKSHNALLIVVKMAEICCHICWSRFCWRSLATLSSAVWIERRESRIFNCDSNIALMQWIFNSCGKTTQRESNNLVIVLTWTVWLAFVCLPQYVMYFRFCGWRHVFT